MSWNPALDPDCPTGDAVDAIETVIVPRAPGTWAGSRCAAPYRPPGGRWSARSSSSTRWGRSSS